MLSHEWGYSDVWQEFHGWSDGVKTRALEALIDSLTRSQLGQRHVVFLHNAVRYVLCGVAVSSCVVWLCRRVWCRCVVLCGVAVLSCVVSLCCLVWCGCVVYLGSLSAFFLLARPPSLCLFQPRAPRPSVSLQRLTPLPPPFVSLIPMCRPLLRRDFLLLLPEEVRLVLLLMAVMSFS